MPAAAIKHNWMSGAFAPAVQRLLTAVSNIRPAMTAMSGIRPLLSTTFDRIRTVIAATIARIRHDPPGD